jgi:hypothetical protein
MGLQLSTIQNEAQPPQNELKAPHNGPLGPSKLSKPTTVPVRTYNPVL